MHPESNLTFSFRYQGQRKLDLIKLLRDAAGTQKDARGNELSVLSLTTAKNLVEASFSHFGGPPVTMTQAQFGRFMALILMSDRVHLPEVRIVAITEAKPQSDPYDLTK